MTASFTLTPDHPGVPRFDLPHKCQEQHRAFFPEGEHIGEGSGCSLAAWAAGGVVAPTPSAEPANLGELRDRGLSAALEGMVELGAFWKGLSPAERKALGPAQLESWKKEAERAGETEAQEA